MAKNQGKQSAKAATVPAFPPNPPDPPRGSITEGLDIVPAFSALVREGKAAQYLLQFGYGWYPEHGGLREEWTGASGTAEPWKPETTPTFLRLVRVWIGMKDRPSTKEEVESLKAGFERRGWEWNRDFPYTIGEVHLATGPEDEQYPGAFPTTADLARSNFPELGIPDPGVEEQYTRWIVEFMAEVDLCVERFKEHDELPHELARLVDTLRTFEIGTFEGAPLTERMRGTGRGMNILTTLKDGKARLLQRLEGIAADLSVTDFKPTSIVRQLIYESKQLDTRATKVDALLNDNLNRPNPTAFVEFIRGEVLRWKQDAASTRPKPTPMEHLIALHGLGQGARVSVEPWLVDKCERWLASQDEEVPPSTFAQLWGQGNLDKLLLAMNSEGIAYVTDGKGGKERIMAAFHAGAEKFGHPPRLMDWQGLLQSHYPGRKISGKVRPKDLDTAGERYKGAYSAIMRRLTD